ncbi:MAG: hypothetical protein JWR61_5326 [Ferruginibacter sp.]|uniref:hypothetical protein n=1 Tax=Ferruginibacter sp. TaxID=1940288 RepID=UPI00265848BE|nr:hypothetical protein [Ferruginibacter sp.]MDB5280371.1 hypothetical protein [Ferruginibacter sp.]
MESLFNNNFKWFFYLGLIFIIRVLWVDLSWLSYFALCITLYQFLLLFFAMGSVLPLRYLTGALMCLQMLLGPTFAYNGLDAYQSFSYKMKIPETDYFTYVLPAVICFIWGLHVTAGRLKGEQLNQKAIADFVDSSGDMAYWFIGIGFVSSIISSYFSTDLGFVFYLLSSFKFVGAFMLLLSNKQLKTGLLVLVFGSIVISSLGEAMFHDLLTWVIFIGSVVAIKYKPNMVVKASVAVGFILVSVVIQQLKGDYRKSAWGEGNSGLDAFEKVYDSKQEKNGIFDFGSLAQSNVRINQGFIITNVMKNVPERVPYAEGAELYQILEAAFLPRILAPNKLNAGDRTIFMKYSGMQLKQGTSMGLSSVGDAYINFGIIGGCFFMFLLGLFFSTVLNNFYKHSFNYPVLLLFVPLVFYYPIRADCELQTSLGHLVKSTFLVYVVIQFWKYEFKRIKSPADVQAT